MRVAKFVAVALGATEDLNQMTGPGMTAALPVEVPPPRRPRIATPGRFVPVGYGGRVAVVLRGDLGSQHEDLAWLLPAERLWRVLSVATGDRNH
ncbi:hypothetical protein ACM01_15680 [Streptomyces viridochromogenes]|uniref:Uncharacterized protein n=1 Tax=Streptomyces viridochromogenes TaxID=1938 RepID=A0A0J7ZFB7_STRVR|nr:hypothetical protein ACM01_15680 [Streptomyces viridochromogenes]